jgi:nitroreductase
MSFIKLKHDKSTCDKMQIRSFDFYKMMDSRRSVRHFSKESVPLEVIENVIKTAATAPSGANKQPWKFVIVKDTDIKKQIRIAAEKEEREFYEHRAPQAWLDDLKELGTDWHKEFLEDAPYLIVVFKVLYDKEGSAHNKHYYISESVGIATGLLITAIHNAGLVTVTHTPSPMDFLGAVLKRPINEKPFILLPVGYPLENAMVPDIKRKKFEDVAEIF